MPQTIPFGAVDHALVRSEWITWWSFQQGLFDMVLYQNARNLLCLYNVCINIPKKSPSHIILRFLMASSWSLSSLPSTHFFSVIIILLRLTRASSLTFCSIKQYKLIKVSIAIECWTLRLTSWWSKICVKSFESLLVHYAKCYSPLYIFNK